MNPQSLGIPDLYRQSPTGQIQRYRFTGGDEVVWTTLASDEVNTALLALVVELRKYEQANGELQRELANTQAEYTNQSMRVYKALDKVK